MEPLVAIVILNYNGKDYLAQFLPAVLASTYTNYQVIVADNASTDDSVHWLSSNYPQITVLKNKENLGYAGGYNWALQQVTADYFVLLNSDVEVSPNWLQPIIQLMEQHANIAACQPAIRSYYQKTHFEYAGAAGGFIDILGYPFNRGRVFDVCEEDKGQYNTAIPCFWASGAALVVKADIFKRLQGFDAFFFAHMEEIDLCWRMQLAGYKIYVQPQSVVYHVGGGTLPKGYRKTYLNFRNNLIMLSKNLPTYQKIYIIPFRFCLDAVAAWQALLKKDFTTYKAIFFAHLHTVQWWFTGVNTGKYLVKQPLQQLQGVYKGSIVWQFFIKKRKRFNEIM